MILVIQNWVPHYRKAFFNALCALDEVVVLHSGRPSVTAADRYREDILPARRIGPFTIQSGLSAAISRSGANVVIASADIRNIASVVAMFRFDSSRQWIWWGMDRGASRMALWVKERIAMRDNPLVFYNEAVRDEFANRGLKIAKLFIANNTFHVEGHSSLHDHHPKDMFLNVGTLDARKKNDELIRVFAEVIRETGLDLKLCLVGDGAQKKSLALLIRELGMQDRVLMPGKIEDPAKLREYYSRAIASVSYGQAGLAVLQSMAFGVPFVTMRNAISGGEKFNIVHGENGLFCSEDLASLREAMLSLVREPELARRLGINAYRHYVEKASVENMVSGFKDAMAYRRS